VLQLATPRLLGAGIVLSWQPQSELPSINANPRQLRVLFRHLIDNAIEAIIDAAAKRREIEIITRGDEGWLEVTVCDSGNGIDPALHYKVFEPFYTTKRGGHTGIGLTLAQEAVNAHAGTIAIDPNTTEGCCISLRLPRTRNQ
jgi:signal transduction histidine kinase